MSDFSASCKNASIKEGEDQETVEKRPKPTPIGWGKELSTSVGKVVTIAKKAIIHGSVLAT